MILTDDQQNAVDVFLDFILDDTQSEMVISGSAGSGKTTLMKYLLEVLRSQKSLYKLLLNSADELSVYLTSTTHKAAKVLRTITREEVSTVHSLLGIRPYRNYKTGVETFKRSKDSRVIERALVIIDEASMINEDLLDIIRKSTHKCKLLFIGDPYQLAPVFTNTCPVFDSVKTQAHLTKIQRQEADSPIITLFNKFKDAVDTAEFPRIKSVPGIIEHVSGPEMKKMVEDAYQQEHDIDDLRIVAWTNGMVHQYNAFVRNIMGQVQPTYQKGEVLVVNEPIINPSSNELLFKNDAVVKVTGVGEVEEKYGIQGYYVNLGHSDPVFIPLDQTEVKATLKHLAKHKNWAVFYQIKDFFIDVRPIHANSVHKSQGSTYHTVFIDLDDIARNTKKYEIARLMYVAISRASHKVVLKGNLPSRLYW